jgi:lipopolysaccharide/colanic/teichoic acid biosynthesis glycosyltransferase
LLDVTVSSVALVLASPVCLAIALAIKLDSRGPVFFVQERVGLNGRRFRFFKFRTMTPDAEDRQAEIEDLNEATGPVFKIKKDPRVTRFGAVLRQLSLDELPQFLNVLRGDMSLVGPRPLPVRDVLRIDRRAHKRRFSVKPGITCLWQVDGRGPNFEDWIKTDMEYIDNWSLGLDLKILAKTIPAVLSGRGAC